jgi:predicted CDP-diglyceride synthetase/phosphatidate cytidylyltransferase
MLGIILTILKYAGIILGSLLGIVLILLLLVLFVPVRYDLNGENKEKLQAKGKIHWLFHIVSFQISYENDEMKMVARIFGVPVWKK